MVVLCRRLALFLLLLPVLAGTPTSFAESVATSDCLDCHAEADDDMPVVTADALAKSVHEGFDCTDCHEGIADLPHEDLLPAVNCGACHEDEDAQYVGHGRAIRGKDDDIPTCSDCHGIHDIRATDDPESPISQRNLHTLCAKCHEDLAITTGHDIKVKHPDALYQTSVHGRSLLEGKLNSAATCNDCHASGGSTHRILGAGNTLSTINHFNIPATCGKCHDGIERDYWEGIHGQLTARGETGTPVCTSCHGEHQILRIDDPRAPVSTARVAEAICTPCHESALLNERSGVPAGEAASFVDSYHGVKSRAGDATVANCASCHGSHLILPSSDPRSSLSPANLQQTCGNCHAKITAVLATTRIHEPSRNRESGWAGMIGSIYVVLIVAVVGFMIFYAVTDFARQVRSMRRGPQVRRMTSNALAQHTVLAITFLLLVLTGFALRFSDAWPFRWVFGWDGAASFRGTMHRTSAVFFVIASLWHTVYLVTKPGRQFLRDMWPGITDARQLGQMISFNLGSRKMSPEFRRFGFVEKLEYWALIWGSVVMVLTGSLLWFDNYFITKGITKNILDVMLVIHFYEAVLATLAIAVWHLYSVIFNPGVYPGNPAWLTGKMPKRMYQHEHGADPDPPAEEAV